MESAFSALSEAIRSHKKEPLLIAIDGRCGSGKTTLADQLAGAFQCSVVHMDHFFLQPFQRTEARLREPGGNVDYERVLEEVLLPLSEGRDASYRRFDCQRMALAERIPVPRAPVILIEGSYSCHPALWDFYDLRVFLDVSPEEQLRRIRQRNGEAALPAFQTRWIPLEERYISFYHLPTRCDLCVKTSD